MRDLTYPDMSHAAPATESVEFTVKNKDGSVVSAVLTATDEAGMLFMAAFNDRSLGEQEIGHTAALRIVPNYDPVGVKLEWRHGKGIQMKITRAVGLCPECMDPMKHSNCDGTTLDMAKDEVVPCPCTHASHG